MLRDRQKVVDKDLYAPKREEAVGTVTIEQLPPPPAIEPPHKTVKADDPRYADFKIVLFEKIVTGYQSPWTYVVDWSLCGDTTSLGKWEEVYRGSASTDKAAAKAARGIIEYLIADNDLKQSSRVVEHFDREGKPPRPKAQAPAIPMKVKPGKRYTGSTGPR